MKTLVSRVILSGAIMGSLIGAAMNGEAGQIPLCHDEWDMVLENKRYPNMEKKIQYWQSLSKKCAGSGLYEFRMGHLYTMNGQLEQAESILNKGLKKNTKYNKELLSGKASLALKQRDLKKAENQYSDIINKFPDWYDGYQGIGTIRLMQGNFSDAAYYLSKANELELHHVTFRHLVLVYNKLGQHEKAVSALNAAYELDESVQADRDMMLAGAISYAKLGKYKAADGLLMMLLTARPQVQNDPEFLNIAAYISKRLQEAQSR